MTDAMPNPGPRFSTASCSRLRSEDFVPGIAAILRNRYGVSRRERDPFTSSIRQPPHPNGKFTVFSFTCCVNASVYGRLRSLRCIAVNRICIQSNLYAHTSTGTGPWRGADKSIEPGRPAPPALHTATLVHGKSIYGYACADLVIVACMSVPAGFRPANRPIP